jgi:hypothetical protein
MTDGKETNPQIDSLSSVDILIYYTNLSCIARATFNLDIPQLTSLALAHFNYKTMGEILRRISHAIKNPRRFQLF